MDAFNNALGVALALAGVTGRVEAETRLAAWQIKARAEPRGAARFRARMFAAECRHGHAESQRMAARRKVRKAARRF